MHDLTSFHWVVNDLLRHVGFPTQTFAPDQEVVSLEVEDHFLLHFGSIDPTAWFMLAEMVNPVENLNAIDALRHNHMRAERWHPIIAINAEDKLFCWLKLSVQEHDLASLAEAFGALIATTEHMLDLSRAHPFPTPLSPT
ncbi:CesT family type III secretion system chaperone [Pandoraea terrae]|nr:CesT family type III secretion system chaperone [Pandoraea terrae]